MVQPGASKVNAAQPYPLCWVGSFSKNFHSTTPATISIHFTRLVFGSFPHLVKLQSRQEIRAFWAQKLRRPATTESSVLPEFKSPPAEFFFWSGQKASPQGGSFSTSLHIEVLFWHHGPTNTQTTQTKENGEENLPTPTWSWKGRAAGDLLLAPVLAF